MPEWKIHMKWSKKMGIPHNIAGYTNRIIDAKKLEDYPEDFAKYINKVKFPRPKARVLWSLADLLAMFGTHDFGKEASIKREILPFFQRKGRDYIKAWYLHFILDIMIC